MKAALLILLGVLFGGLAVEALRTGRIKSDGKYIHIRGTHWTYWFLVLFYLFLGLAAVIAGVINLFIPAA